MNYARISLAKKLPEFPPKDAVESWSFRRKLRAVMLAQLLQPARQWLTTALERKLSFREALSVLLVPIVIGTIYCQIYCLLALQQMHGATMPIRNSLVRASADVIPSFLAFEAAKRLLPLQRLLRWAALTALFTAAIAAGVLIRSQVHIMSSGLTVRHMAVDRLPFLLLAAVALAYYSLRRAAADKAAWAASDAERIPPAKVIDWVKAAGNYVEIRAAGRTRLFRMTLRQARELLPEDQFVQIHRSVIVNRQRIETVKGRRAVRMNDGTEFAVGDAHRSNLPER